MDSIKKMFGQAVDKLAEDDGDQNQPDFGGAIAKLSIGSLDLPELTVTAQYNPRELSVKKGYAWNGKSATDKQMQSTALEFGGPQPGAMTVELLFDGYETKGWIGEKRIMEIIGDLETLAAPRNPDASADALRRPHHCVVTWGKRGGMPNFPCVIESLDVKYQAFARDGRVLRATVTVQLKQLNRANRSAVESIREWFR